MANLSPLASVSATREVLDAFGLATKKSLGQNFLVNDGIIQKIVNLADLQPDDSVLEVGPGIGTLTIALLKSAGQVLSVERDTDLPAVLAQTTAPWAERFHLLNKDALQLTQDDLAILPAPPTKFVANLPYAVAATLVLDFFQRIDSLESATVMVQKEVADRMCAQPGTKNYGAYTVKLGFYAEPSGRFQVSPNNFFPPPHVDSTVLRLERKPFCAADGQPLSSELRDAACLMADASFASRRKTIANSCKTFFSGRGPEGKALAARIPELLSQAGIDAGRRGETLTRAEFVALGQVYLSFK